MDEYYRKLKDDMEKKKKETLPKKKIINKLKERKTAEQSKYNEKTIKKARKMTAEADMILVIRRPVKYIKTKIVLSKKKQLQAITPDDLVDLKISLETAKDVNDFIKEI